VIGESLQAADQLDPSWQEIERQLRQHVDYFRASPLYQRNDAGVRSVVAGLMIALTIVTGRSYSELSAELDAA
jgi:hypothetical protein